MLSYKKAEGSGVCCEKKKNFNLRVPVAGCGEVLLHSSVFPVPPPTEVYCGVN